MTCWRTAAPLVCTGGPTRLNAQDSAARIIESEINRAVGYFGSEGIAGLERNGLSSEILLGESQNHGPPFQASHICIIHNIWIRP